MEPKAPKPFQKLRVFLICTALILMVTATYLDFFCATLNIYTIVGKDACFLLAYACPIIYFMITKDKRQRWWAVFGVVWIITIGLRTKDEIHDYNQTVCRTLFGKEFNQRRRSLGIPSIPPDWHIQSSVGDEVDWKGKDDVIGHIDKSVFIDSACEDEFESDNYKLKPIRGQERSLSIRIALVKAKPWDTTSFTYEFDGPSRQITRQQADSIFAAEKIQKDY